VEVLHTLWIYSVFLNFFCDFDRTHGLGCSRLAILLMPVTSLFKTVFFRCIEAKTVNSAPPRGRLTIVPTPIGDLSPNILKALFTADLIGC
jgi:hypothetical protein